MPLGDWVNWLTGTVSGYFFGSAPAQHRFTAAEWATFEREVNDNPRAFMNRMKAALEDNPVATDFTRMDRERLVDIYIKALNKVREQDSRAVTMGDVYREFKLMSDRDPLVRQLREKFDKPNYGLRKTGTVLK